MPRYCHRIATTLMLSFTAWLKVLADSGSHQRAIRRQARLCVFNMVDSYKRSWVAVGSRRLTGGRVWSAWPADLRLERVAQQARPFPDRSSRRPSSQRDSARPGRYALHGVPPCSVPCHGTVSHGRSNRSGPSAGTDYSSARHRVLSLPRVLRWVSATGVGRVPRWRALGPESVSSPRAARPSAGRPGTRQPAEICLTKN